MSMLGVLAYLGLFTASYSVVLFVCNWVEREEKDEQFINNLCL